MKKPVKSEVVKIRCEPSFKFELLQIANLQGLDASDIVRLAVKKYAGAFQYGPQGR